MSDLSLRVAAWTEDKVKARHASTTKVVVFLEKTHDLKFVFPCIRPWPLLGSVPHGGIKYVRIHYLIDLLHAIDAKKVPGGQANKNFTIFTQVSTSIFLTSDGLTPE